MSLVDFQVYGRSNPTDLNRQTRIVKQGKKMSHNKRSIPISEDDLDFSLNKIVARTYEEIGPFNYSKLVKEGIIDK